MYTCETGMKAAIMKSTEPTRRKAAATRSDLIEALVALPPACYRRGGRIAHLYHATRRTSAHLCLFTRVRGREVLRSSFAGSCIVRARRAGSLPCLPDRRIQVDTICC